MSYLNTLDISIEEFYRDVRDAQNETDDPYLMTFIDCLLASADYESFYKVMSREGMKVASKKQMMGSSAKKSPGKMSSAADSKGGESKSSSGRYDAKGRSAEDDEPQSDAKYSHK